MLQIENGLQLFGANYLSTTVALDEWFVYKHNVITA